MLKPGNNCLGEISHGLEHQLIDELLEDEPYYIQNTNMALLDQRRHEYISKEPREEYSLGRRSAIRPPRLASELANAAQIEVDDEYGGTVTEIEEPKTFTLFRDEYRIAGFREIMKSVGFLFDVKDDGDVDKVFAPNPDRFELACRANGIPIELLPIENGKDGAIPWLVYGNTVGEKRKHPVSSHSLYYFRHDTSKDHVPAIVVAGSTVFDIISSLQNVEKAKAYDLLTSYTSRAIGYLMEGDYDEMFKYLRNCSSVCGEPYIEGLYAGSVGERMFRAICDGLEGLGVSFDVPVFEPEGVLDISIPEENQYFVNKQRVDEQFGALYTKLARIVNEKSLDDPAEAEPIRH